MVRRISFCTWALIVGCLCGLPVQAQDKAPAGTASKATTEKTDSKSKSAPTKTAASEASTKTKVQLIRLSGVYLDFKESAGVDPTMLLVGGMPPKQKSFFKLCDFLESLSKNPAIGWVVLDLSDPMLVINSAQCDELNRRLKQLKTSGKKLVAWLENADATHLSLASGCDEVFMADFGGIDFASMSLETAYFRDAMDLLGIKASIVRAGDFKGAVEPFMNAEMSDHLREHYRAMLESMNNARVSMIAQGRGMPVAAVRELQSKRFLLPKDALARGLVDKLAPFGSMKESITELIDKELDWVEPKPHTPKDMSFFEFMSAVMAGPKPSASRIREPSIVVLHLSGAIQDGKQASPGSIVEGPMTGEIKKLVDDDRVHGVVVRINSPGGSATASESIRQALKKLADKKPTVVSMGETAASGGYWISCIGVPVYAEPTTLTGSIGVFSFKLSFGTLMKRLGVHVETIALDASAEAFSMGKPWSEADSSTLQATVDDVYQRFLKLVAESRKMPIEKVEPLAGGRVWSGAQAKEYGLIDALGGVDDCLAVVAKKAKLEKYSVVHRPEPSSGLDLFELLGEPGEDEIMAKIVGSDVWKTLRSQGFSLSPLYTILQSARQSNSKPNIWAMLPAELRVK